MTYGHRGGSGAGSRLPLHGSCPSVHTVRRRATAKGDDTSQCRTLCTAVKSLHYSSENSATNAWNWNYNNQNWNNNNKSNGNCVVGVRVYV